MNILKLTTNIIKLGFSRNDAGTLASYVYKSNKYNNTQVLLNGLRSFKDKRTNLWGDDKKSNLMNELQSITK